MTAHSERRRVPYSPQQMFDLVADVESYPDFIPWIVGARVRERKPAGGGEIFDADLVISFKVFRESYTSRVTTRRASPSAPASINVEAITGPFKKLVTRYVFHPVEGGGCDMTLDVDFTFRNSLLQRVAGAAFDLAMRRVAAAFESRAEALYEPTETASSR